MKNMKVTAEKGENGYNVVRIVCELDTQLRLVMVTHSQNYTLKKGYSHAFVSFYNNRGEWDSLSLPLDKAMAMLAFA